MHGGIYFWCHTSKADPDKWYFFSPSGLVKHVQFTTKGSLCISECRQEEKNYHWCQKSLDYCNDDNCDEDWGYCSLDEEHTGTITNVRDRAQIRARTTIGVNRVAHGNTALQNQR